MRLVRGRHARARVLNGGWLVGDTLVEVFQYVHECARARANVGRVDACFVFRVRILDSLLSRARENTLMF